MWGAVSASNAALSPSRAAVIRVESSIFLVDAGESSRPAPSQLQGNVPRLEVEMGNPFCHVELSTDAPAKAREFYGKLFQWKFEDAPSPVPGGTYTHIRVGDGTGGGLMKKA